LLVQGGKGEEDKKGLNQKEKAPAKKEDRCTEEVYSEESRTKGGGYLGLGTQTS